MTEERLKRRLAAIFYADMVGYSRLANENEEATHKSLRKDMDLLSAKTELFNGSVVNFAGDAILSRFESVTDAVSCAIEVQQAFCDEGKEGAAASQFRIGINLGDVIEDKGDIYGDGVNIAARLESMAEPGGICISGTVFDAVGNKLPVDYEFMGEQAVKNIADPVRAYRVVLAAPAEGSSGQITTSDPVAGSASIAILPFENMSGDPEQEYFSDGISEDIITDLSKISSVFVIARNSSFTYKGRSAKAQEISSDLGVRYIVEGSVRKSGNRVRITAQLIDGHTGGHVWADRYDGTLEDIFDLQDEVTAKIVDALKVNLLPNEQQAIQQVPTQNLEAYELYLMGRQHFHQYLKEDIVRAREKFEQAIACDPSYARAWCGLADSLSYLHAEHGEGEELMDQAMAAARRAVELAPDLGEAYASLGLVLAWTNNYPEAETQLAHAVSLDPGLYEARYYWGKACFGQGQLEEAAGHLESAWKLSPMDPNAPGLLLQIYFSLGDKEKHKEAAEATVRSGKQKLELEPDNNRVRSSVAFGLVALGEVEAGVEQMEMVIDRNPDDSLVNYNAACLFCKAGAHERALDHLEISLASNMGLNDSGWIEHDSDLDALREMPRFRKLLDSQP